MKKTLLLMMVVVFCGCSQKRMEEVKADEAKEIYAEKKATFEKEVHRVLKELGLEDKVKFEPYKEDPQGLDAEKIRSLTDDEIRRLVEALKDTIRSSFKWLIEPQDKIEKKDPASSYQLMDYDNEDRYLYQNGIPNVNQGDIFCGPSGSASIILKQSYSSFGYTWGMNILYGLDGDGNGNNKRTASASSYISGPFVFQEYEQTSSSCTCTANLRLTPPSVTDYDVVSCSVTGKITARVNLIPLGQFTHEAPILMSASYNVCTGEITNRSYSGTIW